jgi:hypothetical protein
VTFAVLPTGLSLKKMNKTEIHSVHWGNDNSPHNPRSHCRCAIVDVRVA